MINFIMTCAWLMAAIFFAIVTIAASVTGRDTIESVQFGLISALFFSINLDRMEKKRG